MLITMNKGLVNYASIDLYNLAAGEVTLGSVLMMYNRAEGRGGRSDPTHFPTFFLAHMQKRTCLAFETIHALNEFPKGKQKRK